MHEGKYIIAHDVGTSRNKAVLVDTQGRVRGKCSEAYEIQHPQPDRAEAAPEAWWQAVARSTRRLLEQTGVSPTDILGITYCTQMLGIVALDAQGRPLRPAIIWLDSRAGEQACRCMRKFVSPRVFRLLAGAVLCGKDCIPKLLWLKEEEPQVYRRMRCFVDVAGYLLYRSTGNLVMEWTGASVFGLDLKKKRWLRGLFRYVGLDCDKLPPLVRPIEQVGGLTAEAARDLGLVAGTPVIAGAGDAPAAAVGSGAVSEGEGHLYLGTSGWVGVVTRRTPRGKCGVATIHSADPDKALLIAEMETAGACLDWVGRALYGSEATNPSQLYAVMDEAVSQAPPGSDYLLFTPWLCGERAPIADCEVRATFLNLGPGHRREHLLRAVYEGVAYNIRWILDVVEHGFGFRLPRLRVIGGGARSVPWMQIMADVTGREVESVRDPQEAGAVGAALVAGVGLGIYPGFEALKQVIGVERVFAPQPEKRGIYDWLYDAYRQAYAGLRGFYHALQQKRARAAQRNNKELCE